MLSDLESAAILCPSWHDHRIFATLVACMQELQAVQQDVANSTQQLGRFTHIILQQMQSTCRFRKLKALIAAAHETVTTELALKIVSRNITATKGFTTLRSQANAHTNAVLSNLFSIIVHSSQQAADAERTALVTASVAQSTTQLCMLHMQTYTRCHQTFRSNAKEHVGKQRAIALQAYCVNSCRSMRATQAVGECWGRILQDNRRKTAATDCILSSQHHAQMHAARAEVFNHKLAAALAINASDAAQAHLGCIEVVRLSQWCHTSVAATLSHFVSSAVQAHEITTAVMNAEHPLTAEPVAATLSPWFSSVVQAEEISTAVMNAEHPLTVNPVAATLSQHSSSALQAKETSTAVIEAEHPLTVESSAATLSRRFSSAVQAEEFTTAVMSAEHPLTGDSVRAQRTEQCHARLSSAVSAKQLAKRLTHNNARLSRKYIADVHTPSTQETNNRRSSAQCLSPQLPQADSSRIREPHAPRASTARHQGHLDTMKWHLARAAAKPSRFTQPSSSQHMQALTPDHSHDIQVLDTVSEKLSVYLYALSKGPQPYAKSRIKARTYSKSAQSFSALQATGGLLGVDQCLARPEHEVHDKCSIVAAGPLAACTLGQAESEVGTGVISQENEGLLLCRDITAKQGLPNA
jgi:hypothetical protein